MGNEALITLASHPGEIILRIYTRGCPEGRNQLHLFLPLLKSLFVSGTAEIDATSPACQFRLLFAAPHHLPSAMAGRQQLAHPGVGGLKIAAWSAGTAHLIGCGLSTSKDQDVRKSSSAFQSLHVKGEENIERGFSFRKVSH